MMRLSVLPLSAKTLITCLLFALSVGYFVSLLQIGNRTDFNQQKTVRHFRGVEGDSELYPPQSTATLISVAHVHSFSQPVVIALVSLLFLFTGISEGKKVFWILVAFIGSLAGICTPWLIRDVSPYSVFGLYLSGIALLGSFCVMATRVLYETWRSPSLPPNNAKS
ncbi:MAG: hypothetical protein HYW02_03980 [Deltaproteobacteria bacterium]|nr:hypothetical protein [Deltaproteobacteria bacterium]MBI4197004.1 hypothetical protein [Deltaproteobacteria bacterium]